MVFVGAEETQKEPRLARLIFWRETNYFSLARRGAARRAAEDPSELADAYATGIPVDTVLCKWPRLLPAAMSAADTATKAASAGKLRYNLV